MRDITDSYRLNMGGVIEQQSAEFIIVGSGYSNDKFSWFKNDGALSNLAVSNTAISGSVTAVADTPLAVEIVTGYVNLPDNVDHKNFEMMSLRIDP